MGLNIKMPAGFTYINDSPLEDHPYTSAITTFCNIVSADKKVVIGFYTYETNPAHRDLSFPYKEVNYIRGINDLIDTTSMYYEKDGNIYKKPFRDTLNAKLVTFINATKYNADFACTFNAPLKPSYPYMEYSLCKVFFMYKKDHGEVYVYYFYNADTNIDDYFKKNIELASFDKER